MSDWTYAKDDKDWSRRVRNKSGGYCTWPNCKSTFGLGGHHSVPRGNAATRLIVEGGVELCHIHHTLVEQIKGTPRYERLMYLLVGKKTYLSLVELACDSLKIEPDKHNIRSSEVDFE
jgi:hypothetical protein